MILNGGMQQEAQRLMNKEKNRFFFELQDRDTCGYIGKIKDILKQNSGTKDMNLSASIVFETSTSFMDECTFASKRLAI